MAVTVRTPSANTLSGECQHTYSIPRTASTRMTRKPCALLMLPWPWHFSAGQPIKSQRFAACLWAPPLVFRYLWQGRIRLWSPQPKSCKMCFGTDLDAKAQHFFQRESMPRSGQVNRTIRTTPPGAGAAGAALARLLAGLVPGEKLAMGCWMLVAQAARTGFPNCIVPRFQIGVGSFVWNTQKSHGCRTRTPYSLYKGQTMFFGQPHFYLFPNFH